MWKAASEVMSVIWDMVGGWGDGARRGKWRLSQMVREGGPQIKACRKRRYRNQKDRARLIARLPKCAQVVLFSTPKASESEFWRRWCNDDAMSSRSFPISSFKLRIKVHASGSGANQLRYKFTGNRCYKCGDENPF